MTEATAATMPIAARPGGVRCSVLLFDVMGTLVRDPFHDALPGFFGLSMSEFIAAKHPTAWLEFERGKITAQEYYERMFSDGRRVDGDALERTLLASYAWLPDMRELLDELHACGVAMHAFSNYPVWHRLIEKKLQLSAYLCWTFVSHEHGVRKPDPQSYERAMKAANCVPAAVCVIDDQPANVEGARKLGLEAIRFSRAAELRTQLARKLELPSLVRPR